MWGTLQIDEETQEIKCAKCSAQYTKKDIENLMQNILQDFENDFENMLTKTFGHDKDYFTLKVKKSKK